MKNRISLLSGIFLLTITLNSCSKENEETTEITALENELQLAHLGFLEVESTTYVFKDDGANVKFTNSNRDFDFNFVDELSYKVSESKHEGEELLITNPETEEFIRFYNFENLKNGKLQFDLELSTGQNFYSVTYNGKSANLLKWHTDWPVFEPQVLEAVIMMSDEGNASNCSAALAQCANSGGNAGMTIKKNHIWFTTPASCTVTCN